MDATYYALPSERNAHLWVERTPPGFVFNIKAFGLFTHHPVVVERLPAAIKELLPAHRREKSRVYLRDIPEEAEKLIWEMQAQALAPLVAAGKLGCVLFQFPHWFTARRAHIRYLEQLRDRSDWPLAVEFRGGDWMTDNYRAETLSLLERLGLAYVVVDEPQGLRSSTPPVVASTSPLAVVRFHGHNAETYEKPNISAAERFRYLYTEEELKGWSRAHPPPRRAGRPGARADEQLLRRLWRAEREAARRAAGGSVTSSVYRETSSLLDAVEHVFVFRLGINAGGLSTAFQLERANRQIKPFREDGGLDDGFSGNHTPEGSASPRVGFYRAAQRMSECVGVPPQYIDRRAWFRIL